MGVVCVLSIVELKSSRPSITTLWTIHIRIINAVFYPHDSFVKETEAQRGLGFGCRHGLIASKSSIGIQVAEPESLP